MKILPTSWRSRAGFSLVELMVVVAIIGILASLAIPRFKTFQAKARQAEAKTNLAHLYTLEMGYFGDNDVFVDVPENSACQGQNELGFYFNDCSGNRYSYSAICKPDCKVGFEGTARSGTGADNRVMRGCSPDVWTIDQDKKLSNPENVLKARCNVK